MILSVNKSLLDPWRTQVVLSSRSPTSFQRGAPLCSQWALYSGEMGWTSLAKIRYWANSANSLIHMWCDMWCDIFWRHKKPWCDMKQHDVTSYMIWYMVWCVMWLNWCDMWYAMWCDTSHVSVMQRGRLHDVLHDMMSHYIICDVTCVVIWCDVIHGVTIHDVILFDLTSCVM